MNPPPLHLVIVEDEAAHVEAIRRAFDHAATKPDIQAVGTLQEYRERIAAQPPDFALVDLNLPDGRATTLLTHPAADAPFPILVMTAFGNEQTVVEVMKAGALDYVVKSPESFAAMPQTVERALREWQLLQQHKRSEAAMIASEARYRRLFEAAKDGILILNAATGRIVDVNPFLMEMLGYAREKFIGQHLWELGFFKDIAANRANFAELQAKDYIRYDDLALETSAGRRIEVEFVSNAYLVEGYRVIQCNIRDITERKKAEESHARLVTAVEQAAETMIITDTQGTILYVNPAFEKTSGYPRAEALGQNLRILESGKQDAGFFRQMWDTLDRGEVWHGHFNNKRKDGTLYEEEATISPVRDAAGKVINYVAVNRDVTREMQLEVQYRQSQKMEGIGQLAGGVAHDFNNILAAIMMQAEISREVENTPEEVRQGLLGITASAERAANLTRQLLLFSRKEVMRSRQLDLNEVVTSLAQMLQRVIREDVSLRLHLHSAPLLTFADAGMLDQVLMNLAVNARDAMPQGGELLIETAAMVMTPGQADMNPEAEPGPYVCLSVTDTGSGIPPEIQSRIFEPFFTTKEAGKGTGLGLATVFGIVKQHNGWLKVDSEVGKGTTFRVFLPASPVPAEAALTQTVAKPDSRGGSETILVAEDNESLRMLTRVVLERHGYHVLEAADGVQAQEVWAAHQGRIDLLFTDLIMPGGLDGRELALRLQTEKPNLKVLFTSGYSAEIAGRELKSKAGQQFMQKPCPPDQLLQVVRNCLDA